MTDQNAGSDLSGLIGGLLSDPEKLSKVMSLLPLVTQLMGNNQEVSQTTAAPAPPAIAAPQPAAQPQATAPAAGFDVNSILSDAAVADAMKNFITSIAQSAIRAAAGTNTQSAEQPAAQQVFAPVPAVENPESSPVPSLPAMANGDLGSIIGMLKQNLGNSTSQIPAGSANTDTPAIGGTVEKTLDTLKNFTSATTPEKDDRMKLLLSLKPFMKDARKGKIDTAIKYMSAAKILNLFGKNGFV